MYPYRQTVSIIALIGSAALLAIITIVVIKSAKPYAIVGWLWFLGTLVPVIGIVQVGAQAMADRYSYIPSIGFTIAIVWLVADLLRNRARMEIGIATAVIVVALAAATYVQVGTWQDTLVLFEHAVAVTPQNPQAINALGREYLYRNEYDRAEAEFNRAIAVDPRYAEAYDALGSTLSEEGDAEGAERNFRKAIALDPQPVYYRDLGQLLATTGRIDESIATYQKSLSIKHDPEALAEIAAIKGDAPTAIRYFREAIEERPRAPDLHNNLAAMLAHEGHDDEAIREYQTAVRMAPKQYDAHMNLGAILTRHQRPSDAMAEFQAAAQIRPSSPEPHVYTALLYAQTKQIDNAIAELRAAAQIDEAATNEELTSALGLEPKPTNLRDYVAFLESKR
jgi:tetratricopeptide (TPR) repeat protein